MAGSAWLSALAISRRFGTRVPCAPCPRRARPLLSAPHTAASDATRELAGGDQSLLIAIFVVITITVVVGERAHSSSPLGKFLDRVGAERDDDRTV